MKILHTSDWHLGQKFIYYDRLEEHRKALDWLLKLIGTEQVDCLLVAGDIFDIGNPPNYARSLYYNFLRKLLVTTCRHIVITGGNHDSPTMLEAPKELLKEFSIHVVGNATGDIQDEIIELKDKKGKLEAVVAAVPFLRDKDIRASVSGEGGLERIERIKAGIFNHYQAAGEAVLKYKKQNIPIIAMGHLYATGAEATDKQDNIYIGDKQNIKAEQFPEVFDYVALGHIHRAQTVGGLGKVRYCGSIIQLSFSETKDDKGVNILHFKGKELEKNQAHLFPIFRRLKTITGSFENVQERLEALHTKYSDGLKSWVEVIVELEADIPNLDGQLREFTAKMHLELLKIRTNRQHKSLSIQTELEDLEEMNPLDVFRKKCESQEKPPENMEELEMTFRELLETMSNEQ
jgi:exonuclease SbcD